MPFKIDDLIKISVDFADDWWIQISIITGINMGITNFSWRLKIEIIPSIEMSQSKLKSYALLYILSFGQTGYCFIVLKIVRLF